MHRQGLATALLMLALAGCGGSDPTGSAGDVGRDTGTDTTSRSDASACRTGRTALVDGLERRLTARGETELVRVFQTQAEDVPSTLPTGFAKGVYVVSGRLEGEEQPADGTQVAWAVGRSVLLTGKGPAVALDPDTRRLTETEARAAPGTPEREFADAIAGTAAVRKIQRCVRG